MFSLRRRFPSGGYETYAANLVRSSLDLKTMESLFPQACMGPVVMRLVLADEGIHRMQYWTENVANFNSGKGMKPHAFHWFD